MLFDSFTFLVFFAIFFVIYFSVRGTLRHIVLFVASCVFYMWFIPKYVLILFLAIGIDFYAAIRIEDAATARGRKRWLLIGIVNTCALLFIFKYYNFFITNLNGIGGLHIPYWNIILPLGLSFHTFQSLSYVIDVYRKKVRTERNLLVYANYVMMFPQIVAGPIERAGQLIPQLRSLAENPVNQSDFAIGMTRFSYGLFKKMVVADNIGPYVTAVYNNYTHHTGATLLVASMFFSVQLYADFSGYSDMAIGIARALGFRFNENFETPYFARTIAEFWRRWHISLSSWLRDYLYYPLVFSFGSLSKFAMYASTIITFAVIGLWHGANWTFVIFGTLQGIYMIAGTVTEKMRAKFVDLIRLSKLPRVHHAIQMAIVFLLFTFSLIFFRASSISQAWAIIMKIASGISIGAVNVLDTNGFTIMCVAALILFASEFFVFRKYSFDRIHDGRRGGLASSVIAITSVALVLSLGFWGGASFIYFQF